jgi:hypothetical protein
MYKLTRPDGYDFYSHTINYRNAIGSTIRVTDYDPPEKGSCGKGLHASRHPNDCFIGSGIPCAAFRVKGIQPIVRDKAKTRYQALKVLEEIHDLDILFGWKYSEAVNPVHPFKIDPPEIGNIQTQLVRKWASSAPFINGYFVGASPKAIRRVHMWVAVWDYIRNAVGNDVCNSILAAGGGRVTNTVWAYVNSIFTNVEEKNVNTFQAAVDLWKMGLVASFDGIIWRLHGKPNGKILWEDAL